MKWINNAIDRITMYRLIFYCLTVLIAIAASLSAFGLVPYSPLAIILSTLYIIFICWVSNVVFANAFESTTNVESVYITALILALIISPMSSIADTSFYSLAGWASVLAIASKFIFAIKKKHIFNPAAIGVALTAIFLNQSASWWVGTFYMLPFVLIGGLVIVKKIRRFDLFISFIVAAFVATVASRVISGGNIFTIIRAAIVDSPLVFFATVMLTEPLTTPPKRMSRMVYGAVTGVLFSPAIHVGGLYSTPELALVVGNVFSYLASPKRKLFLKLKEKVKIAKDTYDFVFSSPQPLAFEAGQYLEWTLGHKNADNRGNRRYFTLVSSPTEKDLRLGVKFYDKPSSFKKEMLLMKEGDTIVASQLSGDFVLPKDKDKKLVFIAGGIGITPFRSMIKYLLDKNEKRPIMLFYSNKHHSDIAYTDLFTKASRRLGIPTVYALTDKNDIPDNWRGERGRIDAQMIKKYLPDYLERSYYISGPLAMINAFESEIGALGVNKLKIKKDYFPGFA